MTCLLGLLEYRILKSLYDVLTRNGVTNIYEVLKQACMESNNNEKALRRCIESNYVTMWKVLNILTALGYININRLGRRIVLIKWGDADVDFTKFLIDYVNHKESTKAR